MRFRHPNIGVEIEIPDEWLVESAAQTFTASTYGFAAISDPHWPTVLVPLEKIDPPLRKNGIEGLRKERTISLLQAIISGVPIAPLEVHQVPHSDRLAVRDGFHRYYISVALGFPELPVSVRPYFDFSAL